MTQKDYNGWTNYETWLVKLWIDNDQFTQDYFTQQGEQFIRRDEDSAIQNFAEFIKEQHEESLPELNGFAADLMNSALSEVNWEEIASSMIEDIKENA